MKNVLLFVTLTAFAMVGPSDVSAVVHESQVPSPQYLYKIVSSADWNESQSLSHLKVSAEDSAFIHFSTEDQCPRIAEKYWAGVSEYVVLKIDVSKLQGNLVFENNPGGITKYYHLYNGVIPLDSVVEFKLIKK